MAEERGAGTTDAAAAEPLLAPGHTYRSVNAQISAVVLTPRIRLGWLLGLGLAFGLVMLFFLAVTWLLMRGVGIWGVNQPVAWGFAIVNFVWWIGIGHAGTLISAILLLLRQEWRTSINRFAEAMTLFAVTCAGLFPILHMGRPWFFYWLLPYPDTMQLWPQWRSPLVWDVFAILTYFLVSLIFWFVGLLPDLATMRDRARHPVVRVIFGVLAMGWRGSTRHWSRYRLAYLLLAGLATPLVVSVHSIVALDFAAAQLPGWHSTIFPPYFVAGAIFSGLAMVLTLLIPVRAYYGLKDFITARHLEVLAKLMLATGLLVAYGYVMEHFMSFYSADTYEEYMTRSRRVGPYAPQYFLMLTCNVLVPQLLWSARIRRSPLALFGVSLLINLGMWVERYVIVVTSLHRDFLPSSWGMYAGTFWDYAALLGSMGLFLFLLLVFVRLLPMVSMHELRELTAPRIPGEQRSGRPSTAEGSR
ncbi:MAG: NrfD/PsrC family molybdoenzyme membrane anchor subunit [Polyangia bacterium]